jgi:hypothetical protein
MKLKRGGEEGLVSPRCDSFLSMDGLNGKEKRGQITYR